MKDNINIQKGEFQHRIFKCIIVLIVLIFLGLIIGFIYMEFFGSNSEDSPRNFVKINDKIYDILSSEDKIYFNNNTQIKECNINKFYYEHITNNLPCIIKNKENDSPEKMIMFVNKYLKFDSKFDSKNFIFDYNYPVLDQYIKFFYLKNDLKFHIKMSPISQIKNIRPMRNETKLFFNTLYSEYNFFTDNINDAIVLDAELNKGDIIYIPGYYFIQIKENKWKDNFILLQYKESNKLTNIVFKALFNDVY